VDEGGAVSVRTEAAEYRARSLIVSAGAWLPEFLEPDLARHFTITRQVLYWFEVEAPIEQYQAPNFPVWIWELQDRSQVIYGFPAIEKESGGIKIATEQYATTAHPDSVEREVSDEEKRAMYRELVLPYLPWVGERCVKAVSCLYTATPDFHFVVDRHPRMPNVIVASPCSGHGFKHSAAVGEALAELVVDGKSAIDLAPFSFARLRA
jgi:sarcosine oxidase